MIAMEKITSKLDRFNFFRLLIKHKHSIRSKFFRRYASAIYRTSIALASRIPAKIVPVKSTTKCRVNNTQFVVSLALNRAFYAFADAAAAAGRRRQRRYRMLLCERVLCFCTNTLKMGVRRGYNKHITCIVYTQHTRTHTHAHCV